jgi:hypothetical protein
MTRCWARPLAMGAGAEASPIAECTLQKLAHESILP